MFANIFGPEHWEFPYHPDCNSCENMWYLVLGMTLYFVCTRLMRAFLVQTMEMKSRKKAAAVRMVILPRRREGEQIPERAKRVVSLINE